MWGVPLQILIASIMLWQMLGPSALVGLLVMLLMLPINYKVAQTISGLQKDVMRVKDERTSVTNEVMAEIRAIKYFAWENPFMNKINDIRLREMGK
jgi:ABC-type bacteriocin/lantibiotic exporter with double-glycine peptidase domain